MFLLKLLKKENKCKNNQLSLDLKINNVIKYL